MKNKLFKNAILITTFIVLVLSIGLNVYQYTKGEKKLPKQEKSSGIRGVYDIDKNINEKTIDNYLGRSDTVYIDLRMLEDTATWENKGGERMLSGFIEGFEVIPYAYLTEFPKEYIKQKEDENVTGLYEGKTLFSLDKQGKYIANYKESMEILEFIFPKEKYIFLMCGAGGYANFAKQMLIDLGWDKEKIYNIGGFWNYKGKHGVSTINKNDKEIKYDFWKVKYHDIDFNKLTPIK